MGNQNGSRNGQKNEQNIQQNEEPNATQSEANQQSQDPENQGGSLASDGPVSQAEAGRGSDLTDVNEQLEEDDANRQEA